MGQTDQPCPYQDYVSSEFNSIFPFILSHAKYHHTGPGHLFIFYPICFRVFCLRGSRKLFKEPICIFESSVSDISVVTHSSAPKICRSYLLAKLRIQLTASPSH
jgi:hypothetical protein